MTAFHMDGADTGRYVNIDAVRCASVSTDQTAKAGLRRLNWAVGAHTRSLSVLADTGSLEELVAAVCDAIVGNDDYPLAAIGRFDADGSRIHWIAAGGQAMDHAAERRLDWREALPIIEIASPEAFHRGQPAFVDDYGALSWLEGGAAEDMGIRSSVAVPVLKDGVLVGVLAIYAARPRAFGAIELDVFTVLAGEVALGLGREEERDYRQARPLARPAMAEDETKIVQARALIANLTNRERAVMLSLVADLPDIRVADALNLNVGAVEASRTRVMAKLQAHGLSKAVRLALTADLGVATH